MADSQKKLILGYYGIRGTAQAIRYLLEYLELPFEDKRYINPDDWFKKDKIEHSKKTDFPNLPYLIDGDLILTETEAIYNYICYRANREDLLGSTPLEKVLVLQARGIVYDTIKEALTLSFDPQYSIIKDTMIKEKIIPKIQKISNHLKNREFLNGKLSYVDFMLYEGIQIMLAMEPQIMKSCENCQCMAYMERVKKIPQIKSYEDSMRFVSKPFLPPFSPVQI